MLWRGNLNLVRWLEWIETIGSLNQSGSGQDWCASKLLVGCESSPRLVDNVSSCVRAWAASGLSSQYPKLKVLQIVCCMCAGRAQGVG
eukprot:1158527-Pelagomonas_calceolata.AAC.11